MKILSVRFRRLNSLRDEVRLDFADGPIGRAGLFAIVGPTGAGKSTILDAISLALFNDTARGQGLRIVSRGYRDADAEVEFEAGGRLYRAAWSIHVSKPRKGSTAAPRPTVTASLARLRARGGEGEIVAHGLRGPNSVAAYVEAVSGLDFARFRQSMLLAQGQFDAFLQAKQAERSALLEQITGTEIYSRVSQLVFERHKLFEARLEARREVMEHSGAPDDEALAAFAARVAAAEREASEHQRLLGPAREQLAALRKLSQLDTQRQQLARRELAWRNRTDAHARDRERLRRHDRVAPALPQYGELRRLTDARAAARGRRNAAERRAAAAEASVAPAGELRERARRELEASRGRSDRAVRVAARVRELDRELHGLDERATALAQQSSRDDERRRRLEQLRERIDARVRDADAAMAASRRVLGETAVAEGLDADEVGGIRAARREYVSAQAGVEQHANHLSTLEAEATRARRRLDVLTAREPEALPGRAGRGLADALADIRREREALVADQFAVQSLGEGLRAFVESADELRQAEEQDARRRARLLELEDAAEGQRLAERQCEADLTRAQADLRLAEQAVRAVELTASLRAAHGHTLVDGEPCPLCGAREHPAEHMPDADDLDAHRSRRDRARERASAAEAAADRCTRGRLETEALLAALRESAGARDLGAEREALELRADELRARHVDVLPATDVPLDANLVARLRARFAEGLRREGALETERERAEALLVEERRRDAERVGARGELATAEKLAAAARASAQAGRATADRAEDALRSLVPAQLDPLGDPRHDAFEAELVSAFERRLTATNALREAEATRRASEAERQRVADDREELAGRAGRTREERERLRGLIEQASAERARLLGDARDADAARAEAEAALRVALARERAAETELVGAREARARERQSAREASRLLAECDAALREVGESFAAVVRGLGLADEAAFRAAVIPEEDLPRLREEERDLLREEEAIATLRERIAEELEALRERLAGVDPEAHALEVARLEREEERLQRAVGRARGERADAERRAAEHASASEALAAEAAVAADWKTLQRLVGSKTGHKFRQFAQRITLGQLIHHANRYLRDFYPRFSIVLGGDDPDDGLGVFVEDHYEADQVREVSTVSGGEKFLLSMALALGFSQMASRNLRIDTLFIDEGFGTLDGERLDRALTALERLRTAGKTIGIISHVESLRERLPVQVIVERAAGGRSRVRVVE